MKDHVGIEFQPISKFKILYIYIPKNGRWNAGNLTKIC